MITQRFKVIPEKFTEYEKYSKKINSEITNVITSNEFYDITISFKDIDDSDKMYLFHQKISENKNTEKKVINKNIIKNNILILIGIVLAIFLSLNGINWISIMISLLSYFILCIIDKKRYFNLKNLITYSIFLYCIFNLILYFINF
jgi:hypothetical protein